MVGPEARVRARQRHEAARQETRANREHERGGDFQDDEQVVGSAAAAAAALAQRPRGSRP